MRQTKWFDFEALALENQVIKVVMVPELGAKIVSLFDKGHQHEWLAPPMRPLRQADYGADFVSQDMSGWDEMMPTISPCSINGVCLPDHGEIWSVPWQVEPAGEMVKLSVCGKALPYCLTRTAGLVGENCLELHYHLVNIGKVAFPFLWTAHPQFVADPQTRIILPESVKQMVNVIDGDLNWGQTGELHTWPQAVSSDGTSRQLDRVCGVETRGCRKFFISPEQHISWAALVHEERGCQMRMNWSPEDIPYMGLWVDEGRYNSKPLAAPEPSNGYYDSLERAINNGMASTLEPGMEKHWTIQVQLG